MKFPKMKRNQIRSRIAAKGGSYSLAVTAIVLAILIAVNILASVLPTSVTKYDSLSDIVLLKACVLGGYDTDKMVDGLDADLSRDIKILTTPII